MGIDRLIDLVLDYLMGLADSDVLARRLLRFKNAGAILLGVYLNFVVYADVDGYDYCTYRLLSFILRYHKKLNLRDAFLSILSSVDETYASLIMPVYGFLRKRGIVGAIRGLRITKDLGEKVERLERLMARKPRSVWGGVEVLYKPKSEYFKLFLELGFPRDIVEKHLNRLIQLAVLAIKDHLEDAYYKEKARAYLYGDGAFGVIFRLRDGIGLGDFANQIARAEFPEREKLIMMDALYQRMLKVCDIGFVFPFVEYAYYKIRSEPSIRNYLIIYGMYRMMLAPNDPFADKESTKRLLSLIIDNYPPFLGALALVKIVSSLLQAEKWNLFPDLNGKDSVFKVQFLATITSLMGLYILPRHGIELFVQDPLAFEFLEDPEGVLGSEKWRSVFTKKVYVDNFTRSLLDVFGEQSREQVTAGEYASYILERIPSLLIQSKITVDEKSKAVFLLVRFLLESEVLMIRNNLAKNIIVLAGEILSQKALEKYLRAALAKPSLLTIAGILNGIRIISKTRDLSTIVQHIEPLLKESHYEIRLPAYMALYEITKEKRYLISALKDKSQKIRKWAKKQLGTPQQ